MNKTILLAVCGSVSFYKAFEILSSLKKLNYKVKIILSPGYFKFASEVAFEALSDFPILHDKNEDWSKGLNHIEYSKADLVLIAPASVNTINKLANGICDNIFMQTLIATKAPIIIAPAANHNMLSNQATKNSIEILKNSGVKIVEPVEKVLACGDFGKGALAQTQDIVYAVKRELEKDKFYNKKRVLITGGATTENIDSVRGVTNFSSGKMAQALADEFFYAGSDVIFITSKPTKRPYQVINFQTSKELLDAINSQNLSNEDIIVMCAAVSDYLPNEVFKGKLKKENLGEIWELKLKKNIDLLKNITHQCKKIGFKLEFDKNQALAKAADMLENKNLDAVCLNIFDENLSFGSEFNEINFITKNGLIELGLNSKTDLAKSIVKLAKQL